MTVSGDDDSDGAAGRRPCPSVPKNLSRLGCKDSTYISHIYIYVEKSYVL